VNDGLLSVTAAPDSGSTISITHADRPTRQTNVTARAIGIQAGNGNNTIMNTTPGTIEVEAKYTPSCTGTCDLSLTAVGIQTGSGNDTIANDGVLSAATTSSSGTVDWRRVLVATLPSRTTSHLAPIFSANRVASRSNWKR